MIFSFQNASFRDQETGLYNQAYFMEVFNREWHRLIRDNNNLSVLIFDPHLNLYDINEHHHLKTLANTLEAQTLRSTDITCRLDKRYFAMGLFSLDNQGTQVVIERIQSAVGELEKQGKIKCNLTVGAINVKPNCDILLEEVFQQTLNVLAEAEKQGSAIKLCDFSVH